ncbi:MAG: InlB B-repeat-containing protein [Lachnospiraceae bacterium]|nr:InlB B-repeat-containing protein [Lachnospiraceae bacterium]
MKKKNVNRLIAAFLAALLIFAEFPANVLSARANELTDMSESEEPEDVISEEEAGLSGEKVAEGSENDPGREDGYPEDPGEYGREDEGSLSHESDGYSEEETAPDKESDGAVFPEEEYTEDISEEDGSDDAAVSDITELPEEGVSVQTADESVDPLGANDSFGVSGKLIMPEGTYAKEEITGTVYVHYLRQGNTYTSYNYCSFTIPAYDNRNGGTSPVIEYSMTLYEKVSSAAKIEIYLGGGSSTTNLFYNRTFYRTSSSWTTNSSDSNIATVAIASSGKIADLTLPKAKLSGTVRLPENIEISGDSSYGAYVYVKISSRTYSQYLQIRKDDRAIPFAFNADFPVDAVSAEQVYVKVSSNSNMTSNLIVNQEEYYNGEKLVTDSTAASSVDFSSDGCGVMDLTLRTTDLFGTLTLPETAFYDSSYLDGYIYAYYPNPSGSGTKEANCYFKLSNGERSLKYYMNTLPADLEKLSYLRIYVYGKSDPTNLITGLSEYYTETGFVTSETKTEITIPEGGKNLTIVPCITKGAFKVSLSEEVYFEGGDLSGSFCFWYEKENGGLASKTVSVKFKEQEKDKIFYLNDLPLETTKIRKVRVNWNRSNSFVTNLITDKYLFLNGSKWILQETEYEIALSDGSSPIVLPVGVPDNGIWIDLKLPEGEEVYGENLSGTITLSCRNASNSNTAIVSSFWIREGETDKLLRAAVPDDSVSISEVKVWISSNNRCSSAIWPGTYYLTGSGLSTDSNGKVTVTVAEHTASNQPLMITLPKIRNLKAEISLPEKGYLKNEDLTGSTAEVRIGNRSYTSYFVMKKDTGKGHFTIAFSNDQSASEITRLTIYLRNSDNAATNLVTGKTLYYADGAWSYDQNDASVIPIPDTDNTISLTMPVVKSIGGTITFPEGSVINNGTVTLKVYARADNTTYSQKYTLSSASEPLDYHVALGAETDEITELYVYLYTNSNAYTNLATGTYYLCSDGTLQSSSSNRTTITLTQDNQVQDLTLLKCPSISGTVGLAEDAFFEGADLSGTVYAYTDKGSKSTSFKILQGETEAPYAVALPLGATTVKYLAVSLNSSSGLTTNLKLYTNQYCGMDGTWTLSTNGIAATEMDAEELSLNLALPPQKEIFGKLTIPEEIPTLSLNMTGKIYFYGSDSSSYEDDITFAAGEREAEFSVQIPGAENRITKIYVNLNKPSEETDLLTGYLYYISEGNWSRRSSQISFDTSEKRTEFNAALPYKRLLKGNVFLPNGLTLKGGKVTGSVEALVGSESVRSAFTIASPSDRDISYSLDLPEGTGVIDRLSVSITAPSGVTTNLLTGTTYYNGSSGEARWVSSYMSATALSLDGAVSELDVQLKKAVNLSGKVSLTSDEYFRKASLTGYVRAYIGDNFYAEYFEIPEGKKSANYKIRLPFESEYIDRVQLMVYRNSFRETNILTGTDMYYKGDAEETWSVHMEDAVSIPIPEDGVTLNLTLPQSDTISGRLMADESAGPVSGIVGIIAGDDEHSTEYKTEFNTAEGGSYLIELPPGSAGQYRLFYEINEEDSPYYATGTIYAGSDGSYSVLKEGLPEEPVRPGINHRDVKLASWDDLASEKPLLESAHPYAAGRDQEMFFEYPGTADSLTVHFSDCTYTEETFDEILIYAGESEDPVGTYSGTALAGGEVTVPGNSFRIVVSADDSRSCYGFGIDSIEAENGVPTGEIAASVVLLDGVPYSAVILNGSGEEKALGLSAANYTEDGKMCGISTKKIKVGTGMASCLLELSTSEEASTGKLMLYDEKFTPVCENRFRANRKYAVTYHNNDELDSERVVYLSAEELITKPVIDPARPGFRFDGWFTSKEARDEDRYEFGTEKGRNLDLYAAWTMCSFVSIDISGQGQVESEGITEGYAAAGTLVKLFAKPAEHWKTEGFRAKELTAPDGKVNGITDDDLTYDPETGMVSFTMPAEDVYLDLRFIRAIEPEWISSGILLEETGEQLLFENNVMIVPSKISTVTLTGNFNREYSKEEIASLKYRYSHYDRDENGEETYTEGSFTDVELAGDDTTFTIPDLSVGVGTNSLTLSVTAKGETTELSYSIIGTSDETSVQDGVTQFDAVSDDDFIEDFYDDIAAYWNEDNGTPEYSDDDRIVMIIRKRSEIAKRLMSAPNAADHIGIGDIWVIPSCEQFPSGFAFRIEDYGDVDYAPEAPEGDVYENAAFSSEKFIYILAANPDVTELFADSMALSADGVGGIAFSLLPNNTSMDAALSFADGTVESAHVESDIDRVGLNGPGFQTQDLLNNIVANAGMTGGKASVSVEFKDTVIYDHDGKDDTGWDRVSLGGKISLSDFDAAGAFEWHPIKEARVMPSQIGMAVDYTQTESVKVTFGGTLSADMIDEKTGEAKTTGLTLKPVVKSFKEKFGCQDSNSKEISFLGMDYSLSGVDMDSTIVLAAIGFNLATRVPTEAGYSRVVTTSTFCGVEPILVFMVCLDLDGSVTGKISYEYKKSSYNLRGFNVIREGAPLYDNDLNAKIATFEPTHTMQCGEYYADVYSVTQSSVSDRNEPHGTHTFTASAKATLNTSVTGRIGLMISGVDFGQVKGGIYADAQAGFEGSIVLEKGKDPQYNMDGFVDGSIGFLLGYNIAVSVGPKDTKNKAGVSFSHDWKWEFFHFGWTSVGIKGTVKEPAQQIGGEDMPLSGVTILLTSKNKIPSMTRAISTGPDGKYSFRGIGAGIYDLKFHKDSYADKVLEDIQVTGTTVKKDVVLPVAKYAQVKGRVVKDGQPVSDATLTIVPMYDQKKAKYDKSGTNGEFTFGEKDDPEKGLTPGVYKLTINSRGNKPVDTLIEVVYPEGGILDLGDIEAIEGVYGNGTVSGTICDLSTGRITGAELTLFVRKGANKTDGKYVKKIKVPAKTGAFNLTLPAGTYTLQVQDLRTKISDNDRYGTVSQNVWVKNNVTANVKIFVGQSADSDQIRIVLTWGETPRDLDSHLFGPSGDGSGRFHTAYYSKNYYYNNKKYADLDLDDVTSYGPETTTIYHRSSGDSYSFYVHDYSNRGSSSSNAMGNSGATVKLYVGPVLTKTWQITPGAAGTVWHVFDYDAGSGEITSVNRMHFQSSPQNVDRVGAGPDSGDDFPAGETGGSFRDPVEEQDITAIMEEAVEK